MKTDRAADLIRFLTHAEPRIRDTVLDLLSDRLVQDAEILPQVFLSWEQYGVAEAYPELPQIVHLSIPGNMVEECCQRAQTYAVHRAVTDPVCRIAGKLMENVVALPARDLGPWLPLIEKTVRVSKIFFRVDLALLRGRIELAEMEAEELLRRLDALIPDGDLTSAEFDKRIDEAFWLLQAVRTYHTEKFDPRSWLSNDFESTGEKVFKHKVVSSSLAFQPAPGIERDLVVYMVDDRESVHALAIEALARIGNPLAAELLLAAFPKVCLQAQHWIARALQRVHLPGLAPRIAVVRKRTADTRLSNALFMAELLQFDLEYADDLASILSATVTDTQRVVDCLHIYYLLHTAHAKNQPTRFQSEYVRFMQSCKELAELRQAKLLRQQRHQRKKMGKSVLQQYRRPSGN